MRFSIFFGSSRRSLITLGRRRRPAPAAISKRPSARVLAFSPKAERLIDEILAAEDRAGGAR